MGLMAADFRSQLQALLPRGAAWTRDQASTLARTLDAIAEEFARANNRAEGLTVEANPATTTELLADWERVAGLPDGCTGVVEPTLQGRRNALVAKLTASGNATRAYFLQIANTLGYTEATIEEFQGWHVDEDSVEMPLNEDDWNFVWRITTPPRPVTYFTVDGSSVEEPLESWGDVLFECRINQEKPAHTAVLFAYYEPVVLLTEDGALISAEDGVPFDFG